MHHDSPPRDGSTGSLTYRVVTKVVSLGALAVLANCLGDGSDAGPTPESVNLSGGKEDDQGGMVVGLHAGPNGQILYRDNAPGGHDNPAWFHTLSMKLFLYYFGRRERGWEATAVYVTDYSTVDYELSVEGGDTSISTPTGVDTFDDAAETTCVAESGVLGGTGKGLVPFPSKSGADGFVAEHGGKTVVFDDVTPGRLHGCMRS